MSSLLLEQITYLNDLERKIYLAKDNKMPCSTAFPGDYDPCDRGRF